MPATEPSPNRTKPAANVQVVNEEPLVVELAGDEPPTPVKSADGTLSLPPTTTAQQDIVTAGQRHISAVWEYTQATIAVLTTLAMIYTAVMRVESLVLTSAFFLIVGTYFNRTNSHLIGGIGPKATDNQVYRGR